MAGSTRGTILRITTWGESHRKGIGIVIDGYPAGLELSEADIQVYLDRRKPGQSRYTTMRQEGNQVGILPGVLEGGTTGTPISLLVRNQDWRFHDYSETMDIYRPGHADYIFGEKYGFRDYRGGGRSSGQETIRKVVAGVVAVKLLGSLGVQVMAYTRFIDGIEVAVEQFDMMETGRSRVRMPDAKAAVLAEAYLGELMEQRDSADGAVEYVVDGVPAGVDETVLDKLDTRLAQAVMSIGVVKSVETEDGSAVAKPSGFGGNDEFHAGAGRGMEERSNHSEGILGGISDGSRIILQAVFKPTPSIASEQYTANRDGEDVDVVIKGRHDLIVVPRAVVVVEYMTALTILGMMLYGTTSRLDRIVKLHDKGRAAGKIMGGTK